MEEGGDVDAAYRPAVLGTQGDGVVDGDAELASVTGNVVVHAPFQGLEHSGFAVVAAADDEGDTGRDAEPGDTPARRQLDRRAQALRGGEGHGVLHRALGVPGCPGQKRAVGEESDEVVSRERISEKLLVTPGVHLLPQRFQEFLGEVEQGIPEDIREDAAEQVGGGVTVDPAAVGGKRGLQSDTENVPVVHGDGAAVEDLLARHVDAQVPRRFPTARIAPVDGVRQTPEEMVAHRDGVREQIPRNTRVAQRKVDTQRGRRGVGVGLDVLEGEFQVVPGIADGETAPGELPVAAVPGLVEAGQETVERLSCHGRRAYAAGVHPSFGPSSPAMSVRIWV